MNLKFHWEVLLDNGVWVKQYDAQGIEHLWKEVAADQITKFRWKAVDNGFVDHEWDIPVGTLVEPYRRNGIQLRMGEQDGSVVMSYNVRIGNKLHTLYSDGNYAESEI